MSITRLGRSGRLDEGAAALEASDRVIRSYPVTYSELVAKHPLAMSENGQRRLLLDINSGQPVTTRSLAA